MSHVFEEMKGYIGFGSDDVGALAALLPLLAPRFDEIAAHFYDVAGTHPRATAFISGGAGQLDHLRRTLAAWMDRGLRGPHDLAYYDSRADIGRTHCAIGLPQEYMIAAMNVVRLRYHSAIDESGATGARARGQHDAVDKLLDLDLAIMLRHYNVDAEGKVVERERAAGEEQLRAMQTLATGLAHEIRNPLNSARLQLALAERRFHRLRDEEDLIEPLRQVTAQIDRVATLLAEFLDFMRPVELVCREHDLVALARQTVERNGSRAEARGVAIGVTSTVEDLRARIDARQIEHVFGHLVDNAIEVSRHEVDVRIDRTVDGAAVVTVRDDGPGIPPEIRPRVFDPLASTNAGGTGVGLAIVRKIVELHGGTVDLATGDEGTAVTVRLPSTG